jgi:hypothetical protein
LTSLLPGSGEERFAVARQRSLDRVSARCQKPLSCKPHLSEILLGRTVFRRIVAGRQSIVIRLIAKSHNILLEMSFITF